MKNEPIKIHGKEYMTRDLRKQLLLNTIEYIENGSIRGLCASMNKAFRTLFQNHNDNIIFAEQDVLKKFLFPDFHKTHFQVWYESSGRTLDYNGRFYWIEIEYTQPRIDFLNHLLFITDDDSLIIPYHDERVEQEKTSDVK